MIPIDVALLKVISHGNAVHKLQQPVPSTLVQSTDRSWRLVVGLSSIDDVDDDDVDGWLVLSASPDALNDDDFLNDGVLNDDALNDDALNDDDVCI